MDHPYGGRPRCIMFVEQLQTPRGSIFKLHASRVGVSHGFHDYYYTMRLGIDDPLQASESVHERISVELRAVPRGIGDAGRENYRSFRSHNQKVEFSSTGTQL